MHSKIYQISNKPIKKDDYATPSDYYDNSSFADYIGYEIKEEDRDDYIGGFSNLISDVFTPVGRGAFAYKGKDALREFKKKWIEKMQEMTAELTADNLFKVQRLFSLGKVIEQTHLETCSRVDIANWCDGVAFPIGELFEYAESQLKEGDKIYIGSIIDYHF